MNVFLFVVQLTDKVLVPVVDEVELNCREFSTC
jgi:hypothetical protein